MGRHRLKVADPRVKLLPHQILVDEDDSGVAGALFMTIVALAIMIVIVRVVYQTMFARRADAYFRRL
jgi:hypothetical protein